MKVLIVDGELLMAKTLEVKMKSEGYEVTTCGDGKEALQLIHDTHFSVILTEIMLPGAGGLEILKAAKQKDYTVIALIVSIIRQEKLIEEAFELGADDYIIKPYNLNLLAVRLKRLVRRQQQLLILAQAIPASERVAVLQSIARTNSGALPS
jgi:DNA-binding response OmpR family regulator